MEDNITEKLLLFGQQRIPLFSTLLLVFLFYMPVKFIELGCLHPAVGAICVYYWAVNRENLFSYISAFIVGFVIDIYGTTPFGTNMLLMMFVVATIDILKSYIQPATFAGRWGEFLFVAILFFLCRYLLICIYHKEFFSLREIVINLLSTVMFYPLIAYVNIKIQHKFLPPEKINEQQ